MRIRHMIGWCFTGLFACVGALLLFVAHGYSFMAYLSFGIAGVLALYQLLGALARRNRKLAKLLRLILSTVVGLVMLAAVATGIALSSAPIHQTGNCEYVVVLGAAVRGTEPSAILQERLDAALSWLKKNPDAICIVSGGKGDNENISEAQCMFNYLTAHGIDGERIWMEDRATSTAENLRFSLALIEERTGSRPGKLGILSSEFHLSRAAIIANDLGVESVLIPAQTQTAALRLNYSLREIPATWRYLVFGG